MSKDFKHLLEELKLDGKIFTEDVIKKMASVMESKLNEEREIIKLELEEENKRREMGV